MHFVKWKSSYLGKATSSRRILTVLFSAMILMVVASITASAVTHTILYTFNQNGPPDGILPNSGVVRDAAGNLYGTTQRGGGRYDAGTIFKLDPNGNETILHNFNQDQGGGEPNSLILDRRGVLYGTTLQGGTDQHGIVFRLNPHTGNFRVLHSFNGNPDGSSPMQLVVDRDGNLYGITDVGGSSDQGAVFKIDPSGNESVLYSFTGGPDGSHPRGLSRDAAGNLYISATKSGDAACFSGCGVIAKIDAVGNFSVMLTFHGGDDGAYPLAALIQDSAGNFFGTAGSGGVGGGGVVFRMDANGNETVLKSFDISTREGEPISLILGGGGNLFGILISGHPEGTVFKLNPATSDYKILHRFSATPSGVLARDSVGNIYGTTISGGETHCGTVYQISPQ